MSWWTKIDPLSDVVWRWSISGRAPRHAACVLATIGVFTAIQQSIPGVLLLRQLPDSARPLAYFTFGVSVFFNALAPFIVLISFSVVLWAMAQLLRVSCNLRELAILGGISHLPLAIWSVVSAAVMAVCPPALDLQEVFAHQAALELTWQFNLIASLRVVAYLWSIVLLTVLWSRTRTSEKWRAVLAVAGAAMICSAAGYGLSRLSG